MMFSGRWYHARASQTHLPSPFKNMGDYPFFWAAIALRILRIVLNPPEIS